MRDSRFVRGYFYPLDVECALDLHTGPAYIRRAAFRALREPTSVRNEQRASVRRRAVAKEAFRAAVPP